MLYHLHVIDYISQGGRVYDFTHIIKGLLLMVLTTATVSFLSIKGMNKERGLCMSAKQ